MVFDNSYWTIEATAGVIGSNPIGGPTYEWAQKARIYRVFGNDETGIRLVIACLKASGVRTQRSSVRIRQWEG